MGPTKPQPHFEVSKMDRIQNAAKKVITAYFEDPLHYLFYIGLLGLMVTTISRHNPAYSYWLIMGLLTGYKIYHYFYGDKKEKE